MFRFGPSLGALLFAAPVSLLAACSSHAQPTTDPAAIELGTECDSYLVRYEHCLSSLAPGQPGIAKIRIEQVRDALRTTAAAPDGLSAVRRTCVDNLARLQCH